MTHGGEIRIDDWLDEARWGALIEDAASQESARSGALEDSLDALVNLGRLSVQQADHIRVALQAARAEVVRACAQAFEEEVRRLAPHCHIERIALHTDGRTMPGWSLHNDQINEEGTDRPVVVIGSLPSRLMGAPADASPAWREESQALIEALAETTPAEAARLGAQTARRLVARDRSEITLQAANTVALCETRDMQGRQDYNAIIQRMVGQMMGYQDVAQS